MQISVDMLSRITGKPVNDNMRSVVAALDLYGGKFGLDRPHRLAHYLAQIIHENGAFRYDREVWGPTPAQKRYDTRTDLGNTKAADGDGKLYAGRGPFQITGKSNYQQFTNWCSAQGLNPPDFVAKPDLVITDPWEGLVPIWYWSTRKLNGYADDNDIEQITKKINGGLNGFVDRLNWYTRTALVLAGYAPDAVKFFQLDAQRDGLLPQDEPGGPVQVDGDAGPKTRAALHMTLAKDQPLSKMEVATKPSPVSTVEEVPIAVTPKNAEKTMVPRIAAAVAVVTPSVSQFAGLDSVTKYILLAVGAVAVVVMLWKGELIASRVRAVLKGFEPTP